MEDAVILYRGMNRAALDAAYNNSAAVVDSPRRLADFDARSDHLRAARPRYLDLRYGEAERNRIDYFAARAGGPVLIFIHGGYWQMRRKETFSFLATGPLAHGINVALVGYTLAPEKRLTGIVAEVRAAVNWLASRVEHYGGDPARLYVSGWSAGGHLAAMCMGDRVVQGGLAVSGIFDLEPIRLCYLNEKLGLDEEEANRLSPLRHPPSRCGSLVVAYGDAELPELQRQSDTFAATWARAGLSVRSAPLAGHDHFSILEELALPDGQLTTLVRELVGG
ncbi:MAG TPA: alpha/beta hydrolase [Candidatus Methylomirabilis sp.]|nr:alpha/beta hydrolase [Candidatus Methylomirabilis sp.]